ncbi:MAG: 50S ribosomal protein L24 [Gammaproteobacteria bacterium]
MAHVKKDDIVYVLTGSDKGKQGKVLKVLKKENKIIVDEVNMVKVHLSARKNKGNPGQIVQKPAPIHMSNVVRFDENKR